VRDQIGVTKGESLKVGGIKLRNFVICIDSPDFSYTDDFKETLSPLFWHKQILHNLAYQEYHLEFS
jgi:hypothetical protein